MYLKFGFGTGETNSISVVATADSPTIKRLADVTIENSKLRDEINQLRDTIQALRKENFTARLFQPDPPCLSNPDTHSSLCGHPPVIPNQQQQQ